MLGLRLIQSQKAKAVASAKQRHPDTPVIHVRSESGKPLRPNPLIWLEPWRDGQWP